MTNLDSILKSRLTFLWRLRLLETDRVQEGLRYS